MKQVLIFILMLAGLFLSCKKTESNNLSTKILNSDSVISVSGDKKQATKYAVAKYFTPVLNTSDFESVYGGKDGKTLKREKSGLIKSLEYTAYPGTVFTILEEYSHGDYSIYKVYVKEYDIPELNIDLYIDSRFVNIYDEKPAERKIEVPTEEQIYEYFDKSNGAIYIWGANTINGVKEMIEFYPPKAGLSEKEKKEWSIEGLDCSGLLFEATGGYTPRHTRQLVHFGEPVEVQGLSTKEIMNKIEPLDLIVWKGHVIIVYDKGHTIECSYSSGGVIMKDLKTVLNDLLSKRRIVNKWDDKGGKQFVIRRWKQNLTK